MARELIDRARGSSHVPVLGRRRDALPVMLACLLCACGGGGGGGGNPPVPPPSPPANAAPTISGSPALSVHAGGSYSFTPQATDANGDALTFSIVNEPFWADFDEATGTLSGIPFTANLGDYPDIQISVSDGKVSTALPAFSLTVLTQNLGESNFVPQGQVTPTADGYRSEGDLVLNTGERELRFEDADLDLTFDPDGLLIDFSGETFIPSNPVEGVTIDSPVRAVVGMMTGAQINAEPEVFGIRLQDETSYFVFATSLAVDITIGDPGNPGDIEHITLETPLAGQIVLILDPTDPFFYRFGSQPLIGEYGRGESLNGLIPFVPDLPHPELDAFNGHVIERGAFGIGTKFFDFFELTGMRVTRDPQFADIDWGDPFESAVEFRAGLNGDAAFDFAILSVGLFSFDLAQASATLDVGFDRQSMAMQTRVAPDVSWVPAWFPFVPTTEVVGDFFIDGDGDYRVSLAGSYESTVPPADIAGAIVIDRDDGTVLSGTTGDEAGQFTVSAQFQNNVTTVRVEFTEDFAGQVGGAVIGAVDDVLADVEQALANLEDAIADYEFELSLRGLRSTLPAVSTGVIAFLNTLPDTVYDTVRASVINHINNTCVTIFVPICLDTLVNPTTLGNSIADQARAQTVTAIVPYVQAMEQLRTQAQNADAPELREALRQALETAANNEIFRRTFTFNYDFGIPVGVRQVYNAPFERRVLTPQQAAALRTAAANVYRIAETSNIRISAHAIYDALPVEEVLETVRQEVADGVAQVPTIEGMGAIISGGVAEPFVTIGGEDQPVGFNVLRPAEALAGLGELLAALLVESAE